MAGASIVPPLHRNAEPVASTTLGIPDFNDVLRSDVELEVLACRPLTGVCNHDVDPSWNRAVHVPFYPLCRGSGAYFFQRMRR